MVSACAVVRKGERKARTEHVADLALSLMGGSRRQLVSQASSSSATRQESTSGGGGHRGGRTPPTAAPAPAGLRRATGLKSAHGSTIGSLLTGQRSPLAISRATAGSMSLWRVDGRKIEREGSAPS